MLVHLSIHRPIPGKERDVIDSMHRFGEADGEVESLRDVYTLRDRESSALVSLAIWEPGAGEGCVARTHDVVGVDGWTCVGGGSEPATSWLTA